MSTSDYVKKRKKLSGMFYATALPNEYLVTIGAKKIKPVLGGRKFRWFRKFLHVPASVQRLQFSTDNANVDYQGIGIDGYATWRINPEKPEIAIGTLDFFDDFDPMARTNNDLRTICVEAVRHVIANMSIDDALRKKDEIADNLMKQLQVVESKWGIVFDQVGIEKVRIMSDKLFKDLQSSYRNQLRLNSEKIRISTDREIMRQQIEINEKNDLEKMSSEQNVEMLKIENNNKRRDWELNEKKLFDDKQRSIQEDTYRKELKFKAEQEEKLFEFDSLANKLQKERLALEMEVLEGSLKKQQLSERLEKMQLEIVKLKKDIDTSFNSSYLTKDLIEQLPAIFSSIDIKNYSVMNNGANAAHPVSNILNELILTLKNNGFKMFDNQ